MEDLQKEDQSEEQETQATRLEAIMIQLTKTIGEHMQSSRAEIQHLIKEGSSIKEEQSKEIELRNMKVDIVKKPKKDKNPKASEVGNHPTKETIETENAVEEEPDERIELTAENEPTVKGSLQPAPILPPVYTTAKPQAIVAPYPPKYGKEE
ncbi:hypothetical protein A2U01_0039473, partial [Trifolium medium]|nr:hypothetical protein [Trifolium medium]